MHQVVPALTSFRWDVIPTGRFSPKKFKWEPQNKPPSFSLPLEHTLIPLTHGPPPMYWLGTSRWWLGPLCMLHYRLNLFLSGPHTISNASVFVLFCCMFWLVFISCGVKDVWAFRLMFPAFHLFLRLGIAWAKAFTFLLSPCSFLSYVCGPLGCGSCHTTSLCLL